jgi:hypothetical protein
MTRADAEPPELVLWSGKPEPGLMTLPAHIPPMIADELQKRWLPTLPPMSRDEMVDEVGRWIDKIAAKMTTEAGNKQLRHVIRQCIKAGTIQTMQVVAAADRYAEIDLALREYLVEEIEHDIPDETLVALRAYHQRVLLRKHNTVDPQGYHAYPFQRDLAIAVLMSLAAVSWPNLKRSQNSALSKKPSHSLIVSEAMMKRGYGGLSPGHVAKIYGGFHEIAGRMSGLIPT